MDSGTLHTIADRYPWASWAVWSDSFPDGDCVEDDSERIFEFIRDRREELTTDVVLLGLNRADTLEARFQNFHAPSRRHYDYRLKEFIQDDGLSRIQGAYMTDLVDEVNPDSNNVEMTDEDAAVLFEQLDILGNSGYNIVCFGNKTFDALIAYLGADEVAPQSPEMKSATVTYRGIRLSLYRVWFYGLYGANQDKVPIFKGQLQELNNRFS